MKKVFFQGYDVASIPIMIDDVKDVEEFKMTRCTFFNIESDLPSGDWILELKDCNIPYFSVGLSGIITGALGDNPIFESSESVDELFKAIEDNDELFIDINDIWLPNFLFEDTLHNRGDVYRIKEKLFIEASRFREDKISKEAFEKSCYEMKDLLAFSEIETEAFKAWSKNQIETAKARFPKNPDRKLTYRGEKK